MKRVLKRATVIALCGVMTLSMAGCGNVLSMGHLGEDDQAVENHEENEEEGKKEEKSEEIVENNKTEEFTNCLNQDGTVSYMITSELPTGVIYEDDMVKITLGEFRNDRFPVDVENKTDNKYMYLLDYVRLNDQVFNLAGMIDSKEITAGGTESTSMSLLFNDDNWFRIVQEEPVIQKLEFGFVIYNEKFEELLYKEITVKSDNCPEEFSMNKGELVYEDDNIEIYNIGYGFFSVPESRMGLLVHAKKTGEENYFNYYEWSKECFGIEDGNGNEIDSDISGLHANHMFTNDVVSGSYSVIELQLNAKNLKDIEDPTFKMSLRRGYTLLIGVKDAEVEYVKEDTQTFEVEMEEDMQKAVADLDNYKEQIERYESVLVEREKETSENASKETTEEREDLFEKYDVPKID